MTYFGETNFFVEPGGKDLGHINFFFLFVTGKLLNGTQNPPFS